MGAEGFTPSSAGTPLPFISPFDATLPALLASAPASQHNCDATHRGLDKVAEVENQPPVVLWDLYKGSATSIDVRGSTLL